MMMMIMMMETQVGGGLAVVVFLVVVFNLTLIKPRSVHMRQTRHALADYFRLSSVV